MGERLRGEKLFVRVRNLKENNISDGLSPPPPPWKASDPSLMFAPDLTTPHPEKKWVVLFGHSSEH